ncbi:MAG: chaperonin [Bacteroidetes bacterium SW_9_63_38]|nr:MAG: chaperonin [Bacteroidetes bacterium SW_9_63_38]
MADLIVVGDRVLIDPKTGEEKTDAGLVVPASVSDQENVHSGRVVKTGPGYLTQNPEYSETESWKESTTPVRYLPLQANPGDHAFFLRNEAIDLRYDDTHYLVVPHQAILALIRENGHGNDGNGPSGASEGPDAPREEPSDTTVEDIEDLWDGDDDADTPDPGRIA